MPPLPKPVRANRVLGLAILGGMIFLALASLGYALWTVDWRRQNDFRAKKLDTPTVALNHPGELAALGYLPKGTNLVAAIQVQELLKDDAAKALLVKPRPALIDLVLGSVERWAKLKVEDIDHVVVGTEIKNKLPTLAVLMQTRGIDLARLSEAMLPAKPVEHRKRPLFRFSLQPGDGMLWVPSPRTLVLLLRLDAMKIEDMDAIPYPPHKGTDGLPEAMQEMLAKRIPKQSLLWAAGQIDRPELLKDLLAFNPLPKDTVPLLTGMQTFGVGLMAQDGLALVGHFHARDEKTTRLLQQHLEGWQPRNVKSFKVEGPPPGAKEAEAQWVTVQIRADAEGMREALGKAK